ncbi:hypothetical protein CNMCM7691_002858 [Aspergillus felis]|uniref:Ankyrin repeat-containing domain protein n=1 Tax=Aspergillus felis TaxID=1287682 RepID=A0A8H6V7A8_9EURO|nr:hypothetical protein CNMCM7691_002858 [Aspergillus felis]
MAPTLLSLPSKLLQVIADQVSSEHDLRSLTQSHPRLDSILTPYIKARKDREERSKLLISAIKVPNHPNSASFCSEMTVIARLLLAYKRSLVDIRDGIGRTPLMFAAEGGHEAVVHTLLSKKYGPADVTLRNCKDQSVLWYAAKGGNIIIMQMLLDTGKLDPNTADDEGLTPFACAASEGHCEVMQLLLLEGVSPDCPTDQGKTPLFLAAGNGREEAVKYLLALSRDGRVDPDSRTVSGATPLREAARKGHAGVVQQLLAVEGVNPDTTDRQHSTPLIVTALQGHVEVVKLLLATGRVQLNARDNKGMTPLMWAAKFQRTPVVELLLSTGQVQVDFDLRELSKGTSLIKSREPRLDESLVKILNAYKRDNA